MLSNFFSWIVNLLSTCTVEQSWQRNPGVIGDRESGSFSRKGEFNCYILFILSSCIKSRSLLDLLLCKFAFWVLSMWLGRFDSHLIVASLFVSKKYYWIEMLSFFIFSLKVNWTFITWVFFSILFNLRSISWSFFFWLY
jgi:hypothetical protein